MSTWHWERIDKPWKEPQGFGRATNRDIYGFIGFKDMLYAGTYNAVQDDQHTESNSGAEIWRSPDGNDWEQVFKAAAKEYGYILA